MQKVILFTILFLFFWISFKIITLFGLGSSDSAQTFFLHESWGMGS